MGGITSISDKFIIWFETLFLDNDRRVIALSELLFALEELKITTNSDILHTAIRKYRLGKKH
jgi:hypothetical protein